MKKLYLFLYLFLVLASTNLFSQSMGFSYFIPKYGYFSNPVAPINFSMPLKFNEYFQISPGIGLSNIGGMSMTGFPDGYNSERALIGPFQTLELNLIPAIVIPMKSFKFSFLGGVFGFTSFNPKVIEENFNDMLAQANNYRALDSNVSIDKSLFGWGYILGVKLSFRVKKNTWGYIGANYYIGGQKMALNGTLTGVDDADVVTDGTFDYSNTKILYHGLQLNLGAILK